MLLCKRCTERSAGPGRSKLGSAGCSAVWGPDSWEPRSSAEQLRQQGPPARSQCQLSESQVIWALAALGQDHLGPVLLRRGERRYSVKPCREGCEAPFVIHWFHTEAFAYPCVCQPTLPLHLGSIASGFSYLLSKGFHCHDQETERDGILT